jgi:hypothetical protein
VSVDGYGVAVAACVGRFRYGQVQVWAVGLLRPLGGSMRPTPESGRASNRAVALHEADYWLACDSRPGKRVANDSQRQATSWLVPNPHHLDRQVEPVLTCRLATSFARDCPRCCFLHCPIESPSKVETCDDDSLSLLISSACFDTQAGSCKPSYIFSVG